MDDRILLEVLDETASAIRAALGNLDDWGLAGTRAGQYHSDLAADAATRADGGPEQYGGLDDDADTEFYNTYYAYGH